MELLKEMFVFFSALFCVSAHVVAFRDLMLPNDSQGSGQWSLVSPHKPRQKKTAARCAPETELKMG